MSSPKDRPAYDGADDRGPATMSETDSEAVALGPVHTFASLRVPNYRLLFLGSLTSNVGTWMARVAQDWLVLTVLTDNSATALGYVTALQFAPGVLISPLAGAVADRFGKRHIMMVTQAGTGLIFAALTALVASGTVQLWHVYVSAVLAGVLWGFDAPARQAFVSEVVPDHLLANAVGLNSASFNGARLLGPAIAGVMIGWVGIWPVFAVNTLSFVAVLLGLVLMKPAALHPAPVRRGRGAIREGLRYVRGRPDLQLILFCVFMLGTFGLNFQITNALMATQVFGVGPEGYGLLGSVMASGTLAAALLAARRGRPRLRLLVGSLAGFAVITTLLAFAPSYWVYAVLLVPVGLSSLTVMTAANTTVQLSTDPAMRGRVMSLYMAIFTGGTPLGAPLIGWVGDAWGPRWTLLVGAIATGLAALLAGGHLWNRMGRPRHLDEL
ncbi:MFS transporter [Micropruina sp.]|uniref:MFS transporter n=1 Tax=Micropruina sp. TaxID=2737536 RepID=UPI0039E62CD1